MDNTSLSWSSFKRCKEVKTKDSKRTMATFSLYGCLYEALSTYWSGHGICLRIQGHRMVQISQCFYYNSATLVALIYYHIFIISYLKLSINFEFYSHIIVSMWCYFKQNFMLLLLKTDSNANIKLNKWLVVWFVYFLNISLSITISSKHFNRLTTIFQNNLISGPFVSTNELFEVCSMVALQAQWLKAAKCSVIIGWYIEMYNKYNVLSYRLLGFLFSQNKTWYMQYIVIYSLNIKFYIESNNQLQKRKENSQNYQHSRNVHSR